MPDNATPLGNGWFAVELDDLIWEIFDENGTPLGIMIFEDDDWDWEFVDFDDMIPLGSFTFDDELEPEPEEPVTEPMTEPIVVETPRPNPPTGDNTFIYIIFAFIICGAAFLSIFNKSRLPQKNK